MSTNGNVTRSISQVLLLMFLIGSAMSVFAQIPWTDRRYIRIGDYEHFYAAWGSEYSYTGEYYEGMRWPSWYSLTDNFVTKRPMWAVKDFTDVKGNEFATAGWGLSRSKNLQVAAPMELRQIAKFEPPTIYVDGVNITAPYEGEVDSVNPNIKPDRIVENVVNTYLGLTQKRRILAFSQQYHDDYHIIEYTFTNTGNIDADPDIELEGQTLRDVYVGELTHYSTCREAAYTVSGSQSWGSAQWISKRGETFGQPNQATEDSLRCFFSWMGLHERVSWDNIGGPDTDGTGRLAAPQFIGQVFIHSDAAADDTTNDPGQPATIGWNGNDNYPNMIGTGEDANKAAQWQRGYQFLAGNMINGDTTDMWEQHKDDTDEPIFLTDPGGAAAAIGYGPFTLEFGESITFVKAEGANGLSRQKSEEIGAKWLESFENQSQDMEFSMPDGSVITGNYNDGGRGERTPDRFKDAWVYTGMDSILQVFGRAKRNYEVNYDIPQPPQPPSTFSVTSGGDRIRLEWTNDAESASDFGGYRIYRAVGRPDTSFKKIFECGVGTDNPTIVNQYDDKTAQRGFSYYYYIVSFDDGSDNNSIANPGGMLHSNPYYTRTTRPARLKRQAGESLSDIRVVPNPYHWNARRLQFGTNPAEQDKIMFLDIPGYCTIRIFSERGDLVKTIEHEDGSGDESWNSNTEHRQVVVSGVYIAHFEVTQDQYDPATGDLLYKAGDTAIRKFVIIR